MTTYIALLGHGCAEHDGPCACEIEWRVEVEGEATVSGDVDLYSVELLGDDGSGDPRWLMDRSALDDLAEEFWEHERDHGDLAADPRVPGPRLPVAHLGGVPRFMRPDGADRR